MDSASDAPLTNLRDLIEGAICAVDSCGRVAFVSDGFVRLFGYAPDEVVGTPVMSLVHPDELARSAAAMLPPQGADPAGTNELRYLRKDGQVVRVRWARRWSPPDGPHIAVGREVV